MERQRHVYVGKSSTDDFDWGERAAIGARQTDTWFRRMPVGWKLEDGLDWTQFAMQVRDRSMADNLEWVRARLGTQARILVFGAVGHVAKTVVNAPASPFRETTPFGSYVKDRHGSDFVNILNLVASGEIRYCSANPPRRMPLTAAPASAIEFLFASLKVPRYILDLRQAPPRMTLWLQEVHDHWNGFGALQFATVRAFDLVYFVSPVTSACTAG
jgi:erythromycin esterase-like protein